MTKEDLQIIVENQREQLDIYKELVKSLETKISVMEEYIKELKNV